MQARQRAAKEGDSAASEKDMRAMRRGRRRECAQKPTGTGIAQDSALRTMTSAIKTDKTHTKRGSVTSLKPVQTNLNQSKPV